MFTGRVGRCSRRVERSTKSFGRRSHPDHPPAARQAGAFKASAIPVNDSAEAAIRRAHHRRRRASNPDTGVVLTVRAALAVALVLVVARAHAGRQAGVRQRIHRESDAPRRAQAPRSARAPARLRRTDVRLVHAARLRRLARRGRGAPSGHRSVGAHTGGRRHHRRQW